MATRSFPSTWPMPSVISSPSTRKANWCAPRARLGLDLGIDGSARRRAKRCPGTGNQKLRSEKLLLHHGVNQRVELAAVLHLHVGLVWMPGADDVNRRGVVELDGLADVAVGVYLGSVFALWIDHEREVHLMSGGKLFGIAAQVLRIDLELVREDIIAEIVAQGFRNPIEIARHHGRVVS